MLSGIRYSDWSRFMSTQPYCQDTIILTGTYPGKPASYFPRPNSEGPRTKMETPNSALSIYNSCLHAYRAVSTAMEMGADSVIWDIRMRIELTRFEVWGRTLGFFDEKTG